jgi:formylglycine-generating enzyme
MVQQCQQMLPTFATQRPADHLQTHQLIEQRGMTQAQAAESFGVTKPRVSDMVTDLSFKRNPVMRRVSLLGASFSAVAHLEAPNQSVWVGRGWLSGPRCQQRLLAMALVWLLMGLAGLSSAQAFTLGERVRIGSLEWDRHEFTVGQLRPLARQYGFVSRAEREGGGTIYEMGWTHKPDWTWQAPFGSPAKDTEPAVHITFDEAAQICRWSGGRLPTDAEWRDAAYLEQRSSPAPGFARGTRYTYPNGASAQGSHCLKGCANHAGLAPAGRLTRGLGHVAAGTTVPGVNGLFDMGGNVWEWVDTGSGQERITRGASWWYGPERQVESDVATKPKDTRVAYIGFRCVRDAVALRR